MSNYTKIIKAALESAGTGAKKYCDCDYLLEHDLLKEEPLDVLESELM